jgi:hypothetical protein
MVKKPEPPLLSTFDVFRVAHKAIWLGTVEASNERDAIGGWLGNVIFRWPG